MKLQDGIYSTVTDNNRYPAEVFWSEEDGGFIATAPDLPGCSAFGETQQKALAELQDAIAAWIEANHSAGNPIPGPSDVAKQTNEPFGRQPQPVQIVVTGKEAEDVVFWVRHIKRACEFKGDLVEQRGFTQLTIYPRAVND